MNRLFYLFARGLMSTLYSTVWRLEIKGQDWVPRTGAIIVAANHRSYADPPLVGVSMPREVHFLAKKELFTFRPFGMIISALNAHPLKRTGDVGAFKAAQRILADGQALIVFPEGRRSRTDDFSAPKAGVAMLAVVGKSPILPTYIHNSGHMMRFQRLIVRFGEPMSAEGYASYQELANEVMRRISELKKETLAELGE